MNHSTVLSMVTFIYSLAAILYISAWVFKKPLPAKLATWVSIAGVSLNIIGIIMRWIESHQQGIGHAPLSNLYESLVFFACTIMVIYLVIEYQYHKPIIGAFATPIAFLTIAYASLSPEKDIKPLIPALKSNWLIAHVLTCFLGYAAFAIAFGISLMYLCKQLDKEDKNPWLTHLPDTAFLDELTHQMIMFGFLFLSIGIITGAIWANSAWGTYWSWDPKETWSLITWFVYAIFLHARFMRGWHGKRTAYISIIGFLAVLFTYFGVNLLPGLHSYAQ